MSYVIRQGSCMWLGIDSVEGMRDTRRSFPYIDPPTQKVVNDGRDCEYLEGTGAK